MGLPENTETIGLKQCRTCGAEQRERDKFCRQCGADQQLNTAPLIGRTGGTEYETRSLTCTNRSGSFSGALINLVIEGASTQTSSLRANRWTAALVSTLVTFPLWLMIVLLSPLDAFMAARVIARQV